MTTTHLTVLSQPDVVTLLHAAFGAARSWRDFLTDCILDRASLKGLQLLPAAYVQGRCKRPVYDECDVAAFVAAALTLVSPKPIKPMVIMVDLVAPWMPPRMRRAVLVTPVAIP